MCGVITLPGAALSVAATASFSSPESSDSSICCMAGLTGASLDWILQPISIFAKDDWILQPISIFARDWIIQPISILAMEIMNASLLLTF